MHICIYIYIYIHIYTHTHIHSDIIGLFNGAGACRRAHGCRDFFSGDFEFAPFPRKVYSQISFYNNGACTIPPNVCFPQVLKCENTQKCANCHKGGGNNVVGMFSPSPLSPLSVLADNICAFFELRVHVTP